jgi:hypothetical protein
MKRAADSPRAPELSTTRSNGDWVMIVLGIALIALFVVAGYGALTGPDNAERSKPRGPVKNPDRLGSLWDGIGSRWSADGIGAPSCGPLHGKDRQDAPQAARAECDCSWPEELGSPKGKTLQTGLQGAPCRFLKGFAKANDLV